MPKDFENLNFRGVTVHQGIHQAGCFSVNPRPYAALSLRVEGSGIFRIGEKQLTSEVGDVLFLPANLPYEVQYSVSKSIVIHLMDCNDTEPEIFHCKSVPAVESYFLRILEAWRGRYSLHLIKSHIYGLLDLLERERMQFSNTSALSRCIAYMEHEFYNPDLNVDTICHRAFVSRSTLQREFRRHLGVSPHRYLTRLRLSYALNLLSEGQMTVKQIAQACGFSDGKYFSQVFRQEYGYSPSYMRGKE